MTSGNRWKKVEESLTLACRDGVFPGAVLLVQKDDEVLFHEPFGVLAMGKDEKMPKDAVFDLASLTKPICTVSAVMFLLASSKLSLDDRVEKYFKKDELALGLARATIADLLSHSAGLKSYVPFFVDAFSKGKGFAGTKEARSYIFDRVRKEEPSRKNGEFAEYSDLGFILLTEIIERICAERIDSFISRDIFARIGMSDTAFIPWPEIKAHEVFKGAVLVPTESYPWLKGEACGIVHDENCYIMGGVSGHAGLFSKVSGLSSYIGEIFRALDGKSQIFAKETARLFFKKRGKLKESTWALGWDTPSNEGSSSGRYFSPDSIGHLGYTGCSIWIDLEKRTAVVLLTNRVNPTRANIKIKEYRPIVHDLVMEALGESR